MQLHIWIKGRPDEAYAIFDRAQHVSDVNYGPHSFNQLPILNAKMQVYLDNNDQASALDVLDRIKMLYVRNYSPKSMELLPALYQQAELYGDLEMHADEYRAWRDILAINRSHYEEYDLELIEPNIRMAEIHIRDLRKIGYRAVTTSAAEKHLKTALRIAENSPDDNWEVRKDCLLSIADFYTLFDLKGRAHRYYSEAWDLLSSRDISLADRAEYFDAPISLARPKLDPYANFDYNSNSRNVGPGDYLEGEMTVEFTVNERGRTQDLRIVAADPPNFSHMEKRVRNAVEAFVYRPRFVDGKATRTRGQQYQARYFYVPSEYHTSVAKSGKPGRQSQTKNP
ncbi:MAG: energy transducer TonB [Proteobacteria bacterium]|nr:energy transducer TonB [Pseudomonadota bacterium]